MDSKQQFDFWYAVNNTEVVLAPSGHLETFGETVVNYHLVCEFMDRVDRIRVREGRLKALKPEIIVPQSLGQLDFDDFGEDARQYAEWLGENGGDLRIIRHGFRIEKQEAREYVLAGPLEQVVERVRGEVGERGDPLDAVLVGVDSPWEVCLVKLMVELVQHSAAGNVRDFLQAGGERRESPEARIERAFLEASRDPEKIGGLAEFLRQSGIWEKYEDRFFALVRAANHPNK